MAIYGMRFRDYLKEHQLLSKKVTSFIEESVDNELKELSSKDNVDYVQGREEIDLKFMYAIAGIDKDGFVFHATYRFNLFVISRDLSETLSSEKIAQESVPKYLYIHLTGGEDILSEEEIIPQLDYYIDTKKGTERQPFIIRFDDDLSPKIADCQYDDIANWFVKTYQPECFDKKFNINERDVATKLGLTIEDNPFLDNRRRKGKTFYFDDDKLNVPAKTIMALSESRHNKGAERFTIMHECIHWVLHRYYILFDNYYVDKKSKASKKYRGRLKKEREEIEKRLERQANGITASILLPVDRFKESADSYYESYIRKYKRTDGQPDTLKALYKVMKKLADEFKVSKQATSIRLAEFYREAEGIYIFIDDNRVDPHTWTEGSLKPWQTFSISLKDLLSILGNNKALQEAFKTGKVVFVNYHVCLNNSKYVYYDPTGKASLTEYARYHMDECCLVFQQSYSNDKKGVYLDALTHLGRTTLDNLNYSVKLAVDEDKLSSSIADISQMTLKVARELPNDFGSALQYLMEWRGITNITLEDLSGVGEHTISNLKSNKGNPQLDTVVALCIGLQLPYLISQSFLQKAGIMLRLNDREYLINTLLQLVPDIKLGDFNQVLADNNCGKLKSKLKYGINEDDKSKEKKKAK